MGPEKWKTYKLEKFTGLANGDAPLISGRERQVLEQIITYLLAHHFQEDKDNIPAEHLVAKDFDLVITYFSYPTLKIHHTVVTTPDLWKFTLR